MWKDLPKHPLERSLSCPVCETKFDSIPLRRGLTPENQRQIVEQHHCPQGHVFKTEPGKDKLVY